ncbi:MAG: metallophosphoesterase [Prolixibacteraceae bacterium]|jgi:3',5'-cyclic-AMP phosphodiesterase|nr:metallophosphoesterase [Prolixibacteraceae bacterium]MBT6006105.1 metallophosphoesterase [Prolixibacteraceae bacterium]MBT6764220.1 metallophosphoesterase [Prolixibacteraceae bacterium]MBT6997234.1 metallophosphoesterase [Prolixibacteraceae bacterium]MBT7393451.1 metallophosphoesterase [Prolixibacteraceae bacterium]
MKKLGLFLIITGLFISCQQEPKETKPEKNDNFSFVFMTDIHVMPEKNATEGLLQAIDTINFLAPDFVLTGGDNIMDALGQTYGRSDSLYNLYEEIVKKLEMPIYSTMGNHEVFGLYERSGIDPDHEEYGKKLYENRLAKRFYSFDHKNWHFVVLDGIGFTEDRKYYGIIDSVQIEWLKQDLESIGKDKPVVVSTHIPLLSVGNQVMRGPTEGFSESSIITNAQEIMIILEQYNVKLVLQGHLHFLEDICYNGIHYVTAGAVSSNWWKGQRFGIEEGFAKINISGEEFNWEYVDFGWEVEEE